MTNYILNASNSGYGSWSLGGTAESPEIYVLANNFSVITQTNATASLLLAGAGYATFISSSITNYGTGNGIESYGNLDLTVGAGSTISVNGAAVGASLGLLSLNNAGLIDGQQYAIYARQLDVYNSGTIKSVGTAIKVTTFFPGYVHNTGTIAGSIAMDFGLGDEVVENDGTINGIVLLGGGTNRLVNSGRINTGVQSDAGVDTVDNSGYIRYLSLGGGNDYYTGGFNAVAQVSGGDNDDYFFTTSGHERFYGDYGNDTYEIGANSAALLVNETLNAGSDTVRTTISRTLASFPNVENIILDGDAAISATGNGAANTLSGYENDAVNLLRGLGGNDTYTIGKNDTVDESAAGSSGADTINLITYGTISYSMSNTSLVKGAVENLNLWTRGYAATGTVTGNASNNVFTHTQRSSNDVKLTFKGLAGNDIYVVDSHQIVDESAAGSNGTDRVRVNETYSLSDTARVKGLVEQIEWVGENVATATLTGNALANTLIASTAATITLQGLGANDIYMINSGSVIVDESAIGSTGTDTVMSSYHVDLSDTSHFRGAIENVTQTSDVARVVVGNGLNNVITATTTASTSTGSHILKGLGGSDTYVIGATAVVDESASGSNGTDTIQSSVTVDLGNTAKVKGTVENVTLTGTAAANAIAANTTVANKLTGNIKANILDGKGGADMFVFNTAYGSGNIDTVKGFVHAQDEIQLDDAIFKGLGTAVEAAEFRKGVGITTAANADQHLIYNTSNGALYWDFDGNKAGGVGPVQIAILTDKPALDHTDFAII